MVDLIEPSEILVDPIELMELCPVERPKVDINDSTRLKLSFDTRKLVKKLDDEAIFAKM